MVSTPLKNISQNENLPQIGVKIPKNIWVATTQKIYTSTTPRSFTFSPLKAKMVAVRFRFLYPFRPFLGAFFTSPFRDDSFLGKKTSFFLCFFIYIQTVVVFSDFLHQQYRLGPAQTTKNNGEWKLLKVPYENHIKIVMIYVQTATPRQLQHTPDIACFCSCGIGNSREASS